MSDIVERLRHDAAQLLRMAEAAKFGEGLSVRVKDPDLLIATQVEAADHIEELEAEVAKWRQCWEDDRRDVRYFAKAMTAQRRAAAAEARATSLEQRLRDAGVEI